jgi:hypothetical protein
LSPREREREHRRVRENGGSIERENGDSHERAGENERMGWLRYFMGRRVDKNERGSTENERQPEPTNILTSASEGACFSILE